MTLFDKVYRYLCITAYKQAPRIQKQKKRLMDKEEKSGVIKNGVTFLMPSYKKYFFCDEVSGEGWFFRMKPMKEAGKYPIVIYHHGNGLNRAGKNNMQMYEFSWLKKNLNKQKCHRVVVHADVACEYNTDEHSRALDGIIEHIQNTYRNVDFDRIYLAGTSHGGYACVYEILRKPDKYAGAVIAMGYTYNELFELSDELKTNEFMHNLTEEDYKILAKTAWYIAWAKDDSKFITDSNKILQNKLRDNGADVKAKIYESGGHTIASDFFKNGDWAKWMFEINRRPIE